MDGFGSSSSWNNWGFPQFPPQSSGDQNVPANASIMDTSNVIPMGDGGVSNPVTGGLPTDPVERRRVFNRKHSETYRRKKQDHVMNLENREKSINEALSNGYSEVEYHMGAQSEYDTKNSSLRQNYYEMSSKCPTVEDEMEIMTSELKEQKLVYEVHKALRSDKKKKNRGK